MPAVPKKVTITLLVLVATLVGWLGYAAWNDYERDSAETPLTYSALLAMAEEGRIAALTFAGGSARAVATDDTGYRAVVPESGQADLLRVLRERKADVSFSEGSDRLLERTRQVAKSLLPLAPLALLAAFLAFGGGQFFGIGRSVQVKAFHTGVGFRDVAGVDEAKSELQETVEFLRDPSRFAMAGARVPKGILLVGPPGNGKTMLAKAAATEAGVPFFTASGSEFVEMFVGIGASRVRGLFAKARAKAPCVIFIDEIDALAGKRGDSNSHGEREQTLNQLLVEMDGIASQADIVIIAATNRVDVLDPALTRPGRFDRHIHVANPDVAGREAILAASSRRLKLDESACLRTVARSTPGFSGAELANLANEAALAAARDGRTVVGMADFERAKDRVLMGTERRSLTMSEHERHLTAVHEAGHALVSIRSKNADPVHKATIIPRGGALGMVVRLPEGDRVSLPKAKLMTDIAVAMAGRAAEELAFGPDAVTTGAEADFRAATDIAKRMVTAWGMSEAVGYVSIGAQGGCSERNAWLIDQEIRRITDEGMQQARRILAEDRGALERIAEALLERETLTGVEIVELADDAEDTAGETVVPMRVEAA